VTGRLLLAAVALLPTVARAQGAWPAYAERFDAFVREQGIVGASTILVKDGRIVASRHVGFADLERRQRVDSNTIFHYGSITKTLVAVTILQLRDRGRLSLDDKVVKYVPELARIHGPTDRITIRHLLNHTSGLQISTWPWGQGRDAAPWEPFEPTEWEQLVAMMPYQKLEFEPGAGLRYSNPGFIYLARVVETLTGEPWIVYVQKNVFAPLGMTRSYFSTTPYHLAEHRSNSYRVRRDSAGRVDTVANGREFDPGITNPNGGWNAPLSDLAKYIGFLSGPGREALRDAWAPTVRASAATADRPVHIGLAFNIFTRGSSTFVGHTGGQNSYSAFLYFNPASGSGVVAVFNTSSVLGRRTGFAELAEASLELLR
jgi:CubicO group peptidase (beta-lactamase class C family)